MSALVTSRLDFNNSILTGLPAKTIAPMQKVQNAAARLITKTRKREHITPVLQGLHWLPVAQRIKHKILTLTHKTLQNRAPLYLKHLVQLHTGKRNTRSALNKQTLVVKRTRTSYGDRSFVASAAKLWNLLPRELANTTDYLPFKTALKTFLFKEHYGTAL